ncbi:DUF2510 domain-containing protein [Leifsonia shinshuensis]|uniref:DUF2510 domain-containing protein n=1 Tax=Leifsonia shinshuensis TaxID=150026 RepID=A0A7G6Y8X3_9MICO|nr:DUF2510 domain-containing protein [Leifsonia shinshuensis]QNE34938.1 DUF2510 domain-containing protein [Leifsonia shinshuensis]
MPRPANLVDFAVERTATRQVTRTGSVPPVTGEQEGGTTSPRVDFAGINALASRPAGYAVALKCLQVQADAEDGDPALRSGGHVRLHPDAWSWYQGALGEIQIGALLDQLGPEWFVRHSVPIGADTKDVDHLVIGPAGVFAINTKHHAGASVWVGDHVLRVNNANTSHLVIARSDALDVGRRLSQQTGFPVPVTAVIAVLHAKSVKDIRSAQNRSIAVLDARQLVAWVSSQPAQLSATKIELLKLAAEEPMTWHNDPRAADTLRVMQRFERLVARVEIPDRHATRASSPSRPVRRPTGRTNTGSKKNRKPATRVAALADVFRVWFAAAVVVVAILVVRGVADQPCGSPLACVLPSIYLVWRPILPFSGLVAVALALLRTGQYAIPRISSSLRRRVSRPARARRSPTPRTNRGRHEGQPMNPPAGWYADPAASGLVRYWDGAAWTEHTAPHAPVPPAAAPFVSSSGDAPHTADPSYRDPAGYAPAQSYAPAQFYTPYSTAPANPHYVVAVPPKNSKATRSLVWGIISLFINPFALPSILAIVFGAQSRTTADQMERAGLVDSGRARATAGLVLGCVGAGFFVLWAVLYVTSQFR